MDISALITKPRVYNSFTSNGVIYQVENLRDVWQEIDEYATTHWNELAVSKEDVPLDMDWEKFIKRDLAGEVLTITVRKDNKLIGYHVSFIGTHLHYKSTLHAWVDLYYINKDYRKAGVGSLMLIYVEKIMKQIGVKKIQSGCKMHQSHQALFESLGYTASDLLMWKVIK